MIGQACDCNTCDPASSACERQISAWLHGCKRGPHLGQLGKRDQDGSLEVVLVGGLPKLRQDDGELLRVRSDLRAPNDQRSTWLPTKQKAAHLWTDSVDDHAESLIQAHLRVSQGDLAQQLDNLLNRLRQQRDKDGTVKVPGVALGETAGGSEADGGVGRIVAAEQVNKEAVDLWSRRASDVFADPLPEQPGDSAANDSVAVSETVNMGSWRGLMRSAHVRSVPAHSAASVFRSQSSNGMYGSSSLGLRPTAV